MIILSDIEPQISCLIERLVKTLFFHFVKMNNELLIHTPVHLVCIKNSTSNESSDFSNLN